MIERLRFAAPTVLEYFASLVAEDASLSVLEAAAAVGQDEYPQLDTQAVLAQIDALADTLVRRMPDDAAPLHRVRLLNRYFFEELGFAGNVNDFYDPRNSYLSHVLATRRGIPLTLALLYVELANQCGLSAAGVSFPGHFLVKLRLARGEVVIDPFTGESMSREELTERLAPYRRQRGLVGGFDAPLGLFLQAASPRAILARLLHNLKEIFRSGDDWPRLLAVQQRLVVLLPDAPEEQRDRGLVQAELGRHDLAADDISAYLSARPDAADAAALRRQVMAWRRAGRPRLH